MLALQNPKIEPGVLWEDGSGVTLTSFHSEVDWLVFILKFPHWIFFSLLFLGMENLSTQGHQTRKYRGDHVPISPTPIADKTLILVFLTRYFKQTRPSYLWSTTPHSLTVKLSFASAIQPTSQPTFLPTSQPSMQPHSVPTMQPSRWLFAPSSMQPSRHPTLQPIA